MNKTTKGADKTRALILLLFACATMYTMEKERTIQDLQGLYTRSLDGLLDLIDGRELSEGSNPYAGFHDILRAQGDDLRPLQAAAAHKLGCMCKCGLWVPEREFGPEGAQRYFSLAARYGHGASLEELARCACEMGHYSKALDAWRLQRFFEIGDLCKKEGNSSEVLEEIESALNFIPRMAGKAKKNIYYKEALEAIQRRLNLCAGKGNLVAACLLGRLYAATHDRQAIQYVQEILIPKLLERDLDEVCQLIEKTQGQQVLQIAAEAGDMQATMLLGFVLFYEHNFKQSYFLLNKASQAGINKARVYRILMDINGLGIKQSFSYAYTMLQEWSKSKKGRAWIALLASMVDKETLDISEGKKQG
ncbi:MAG TPA: hypothetical protein PKD74_02380 [Candidatus Dependentiae bacterium]|nr:hypothetical protein [Candidatus Dependentiae bacterium]